MDLTTLRLLLEQVASGQTSIDHAAQELARGQMYAIEGATVDLGRSSRCGLPEVIYGEGKPPEMIVEIAETLIGHGAAEVLITRLPAEPAKSISSRFAFHRYHPSARTLRVASRAIAAPAESGVYGPVAVVTAGSTDRPVAAEAAETLAWMGVRVMQMDDIGVAGPQRLLSRLDDLRQCQVAVVAAGMEGALPSVLAGHVPYPVIAVPTSVGYGAALGGLTPLLTMLTSCASNVAVVNIDAGFKAGYLAGLIARKHVQN